MNRVDGKIALVTGAGAGIGRATCELLALAGAKVVVTDINLIAAEETVKSITSAGGEALAIQHDVASEDDWERAINKTLESYSKLDVLVNNAGICVAPGVIDTSLADWRREQSVILEGTFLGVRSAMRVMKDNVTTGSIINISSIAALNGENHSASYAACKAGVKILSKCAAVDCGKAGYNIRVNTLFPGTINTPMSEQFEGTPGWELLKKVMPLGRLGEPIEIARGVLFLASDDSSFMTGSDLVIDGGITAGGVSSLFDFGRD